MLHKHRSVTGGDELHMSFLALVTGWGICVCLSKCKWGITEKSFITSKLLKILDLHAR